MSNEDAYLICSLLLLFQILLSFKVVPHLQFPIALRDVLDVSAQLDL